MATVRAHLWLASLSVSLCFPPFVVAQVPENDPIGPITSALRAGKFDQALKFLQPELQQNPKNAQLWALEGIALSGSKDKKAALGAFNRALALAPNYLPALEGSAQIEYETDGKNAALLLHHGSRSSLCATGRI